MVTWLYWRPDGICDVTACRYRAPNLLHQKVRACLQRFWHCLIHLQDFRTEKEAQI